MNSTNRLSLRLFMCIAVCLITPAFISPGFGQIDVTRFASNDFFTPEPNLSIGKEEPKEEEKSWIQIELEKGVDFWENGDYDDAIHQFEEILKSEGEIPVLSYYIGLVNFEREKHDLAKEYFQETLEQDPLFLDARYMLGLTEIENNSLKEAKAHFQYLEEVKDFQAHGYHGMGLYFLEKENTFSASNNFQKCVETNPNFVEAYIPFIMIDLYNGRKKRALETIEEAVDANPTWEKGIMMRGMLALMVNENIEQFNDDVDQLIDLAPENYHYHSMKGFLQMELGEYHEAVKEFYKTYQLSSDPTRKGAFKFSSKLRKEEGIHRGLNYYFENHESITDGREELEKGICELVADNEKKALLLFDSANMKVPSAVAHNFCGIIYKSLYNKQEEAIEAFSLSIGLDSSNWCAFSYRGDLNLELEKMGDAYEDYSTTIKLKPKAKDGYKSRSGILINKGLYMNAYKDLSLALAIDKTDTDLYFNRAACAINMENYKNAEADLARSLELKSKDGDAFYLLYHCKIHQRDTLNSIAFLDSASKYEKYEKTYHEELLKWGRELEDQEYQLAALNRLAKYYSWEHKNLYERGKFLYELERYKDAKLDFIKLEKRKRITGEVYFFLSEIYREEGEEKKSERYLKKATKAGYSPPKK